MANLRGYGPGGLAADPSPPSPPASSTGNKVAMWVGGGIVGLLVLKALGVFDVR